MEQKHRTILRLHWSKFRDLEPKNILPKLVTVLIETDEEVIKAQSTRQERCDKLLEILPRRGPTAFKVFVEALKQTVPHLAVVLSEADEKTEDELIDPKKQSARLTAGICELETELETEKQNHIKTLQVLKKRKTLHGKGKEAKEEEQDETRQKENFKDEDEPDYLDEKNKQEKQSENLEAAKEEQEMIRQLQWENTQLKEILAREQQMKKLKDSLETCQELTKDVLLEKMRLENKRLQEQSNAERSNYNALSEEVRRLKEISGIDASCSHCVILRKERNSAITEIQILREEIQLLNERITKVIKDYQPNTQTAHKRHQSPQEKPGNLPHKHNAVNKKHQEEIKDLQNRKKTLEDLENSREKLEKDLLKSERDLEKLKNDFACENERVKEYQQKFEEESKAKDDLLQQKLKNERPMNEEKSSLQEKLKEEISKSDNLKKEVHRLRFNTEGNAMTDL